jgi:hypothetical protein
MDRTSITLPCPGSGDNLTVIVPTRGQAQYGIGHPTNTGGCTLFIGALDANGNPINPQNDLQLNPGDSRTWYYPPSGVEQIVAVCSNACSGDVAVLEYDTPIC